MSQTNKQHIDNPEAEMDIRKAQWGSPLLRGVTAFAVGGGLIQTGLALLGVQLDHFAGMSTFSINWVIAMLPLPVLTGVVVGMIYGYGGKYLAHFPPLAVLMIDYLQSAHTPLAAGDHVLPWGIWAMFVILQMEFCAAGGFIGEIIVRRRTGWYHRYGSSGDAEQLPDNDSRHSSS